MKRAEPRALQAFGHEAASRAKAAAAAAMGEENEAETFGGEH